MSKPQKKSPKRVLPRLLDSPLHRRRRSSAGFQGVIRATCLKAVPGTPCNRRGSRSVSAASSALILCRFPACPEVAHALPRPGAILTEAMPRKLILVLLGCSALAAQQVASQYGITLQYAADFTGHSWTQEPKLTQQEIGTDIPEGVAPLRPVLHLKGRLPNRADDNNIAVIPAWTTSP